MVSHEGMAAGMTVIPVMPDGDHGAARRRNRYALPAADLDMLAAVRGGQFGGTSGNRDFRFAGRGIAAHGRAAILLN